MPPLSSHNTGHTDHVIRRFLSGLAPAAVDRELVSYRVSPVVQWTPASTFGISDPYSSLTQALGLPQGFCPVRSESTRDLPLVTGSALRRCGFQRLLRRLLTSAIPSRHLSMPVAQGRMADLPGNSRDLHAYACRIYVVAFRASTGLCSSWPAHPATPPHIRFLFVRPALCLRLPSDSASRWTPLPFS